MCASEGTKQRLGCSTVMARCLFHRTFPFQILNVSNTEANRRELLNLKEPPEAINESLAFTLSTNFICFNPQKKLSVRLKYLGKTVQEQR